MEPVCGYVHRACQGSRIQLAASCVDTLPSVVDFALPVSKPDSDQLPVAGDFCLTTRHAVIAHALAELRDSDRTCVGERARTDAWHGLFAAGTLLVVLLVRDATTGRSSFATMSNRPEPQFCQSESSSETRVLVRRRNRQERGWKNRGLSL